MERFTISLEEPLAEAFDQLIEARGYTNRSEAVRDMLRAEIEESRQSKNDGTHCVASLSYVYNHDERELAERLTHLQHEHHDLCVATTHAHLDHQSCLETLSLRERHLPCALCRCAVAERGVHHGRLNLITVEVGTAQTMRYQHADPHAHALSQGAHDHAHPHVHLKPRS